MQSIAQTVDLYIDEAPTERRAALEKLRDLCRSLLTGYKENMEYGMPVYKKNGVAEVGFASQKNYIALYILKQEALAPYRHLLTRLSVGKGCIRYPKPEKIDFEVVEKLLRATVQSSGQVC